METVNKIELNDENIFPDEDILKNVLGESYSAYLELIQLFGNHDLVHEWRYYKDGKSWLLKVQKKKRTIVWMSAWKGYMNAAVYVPAKYIEDIYKLNISEETKEKIASTKNIGKSKPCIFEIRDISILTDLERVMEFKIQNK